MLPTAFFGGRQFGARTRHVVLPTVDGNLTKKAQRHTEKAAAEPKITFYFPNSELNSGSLCHTLFKITSPG